MKPIITLATLVVAVTGLLSGDAVLVAIANAVLGFGVAAVDGLGARRGKLTALSFFAVAAGFAGVGNWIVASDAASGNTRFLGYSAPEFFLPAAFLNYVGTAVVLFGGWCAERFSDQYPRGFLLPIDFRTTRSTRTPFIAGALAVLVLIADRFDILPSFGKLTDVLVMLPVMSVFILARWGYEKNNGLVVLSGLLLAGLLSWQALLYAYLRGEILLPWVSFAFGAYTGRPRPRTLLTPPFLLTYATLAAFVVYFGPLGQMRAERIYGSQRIPRLVELREDPLTPGGQNVLVRNATITKQSRLLDLVEQHGFYSGESMSYYRYVFIPRFLWPDKPNIQMGGWFAHQLGLASDRGDERYTNAINMTVPGELYLNFGWTGLVLGCTGMGFLVILLWRATHFWQSTDNIPGNILAFALIKRGLDFLGPDMQSLVGYITMYLVMLAITLAAHRLWPVRRAPQPSLVGGWDGVRTHYPTPPAHDPAGTHRGR